VVLVPGLKEDVYKLGRLVWGLAIREHSQSVLFLSVVPAPGDELEFSHQLAKLASVTKDPHFQVSTQILFHASWPAAIRGVVKPGDRIFCLEDRTVQRWITGRDSLSQRISRKLKVPVYLLS
jgi:hypothetical protein